MERLDTTQVQIEIQTLKNQALKQSDNPFPVKSVCHIHPCELVVEQRWLTESPPRTFFVSGRHQLQVRLCYNREMLALMNQETVLTPPITLPRDGTFESINRTIDGYSICQLVRVSLSEGIFSETDLVVMDFQEVSYRILHVPVQGAWSEGQIVVCPLTGMIVAVSNTMGFHFWIPERRA